jgi:hypothetical protein
LEDRTLLSASLHFDSAAGNLSILGDAADTTIRQTFSSTGFLEVAIDGQSHSSDPTSAFFDKALAGASANNMAGIRLDGGGGHDTLTLAWEGFENRPTGSLTVNGAGADVVAEDLTVAGALTIQAQRISVDGPVRASAITFTGSAWITIEADGHLNANQINLASDVFVNSGQLHADGLSGGQVIISARNILYAGAITADGSGKGDGGAVRIAFASSYIDTVAAVTSANGGAAGHGGELTVDGGAAGRLFSSGVFHATGSVGGSVGLFGREVVLDGTTVDASGEADGGAIQIGGSSLRTDFKSVSLQEPHTDVVNSETATVTGASTLRANALSKGDGGRVMVWSDQDTHFGGSVSARGGPTGGAGGFIEVSSKGALTYGGSADAGAPAGKAGTLLLDPKNLIISAAPAGIAPQYDLIDPHPTAGGGFGGSVTVLSNGNVVVTNSNDDFGGTTAGAVYLFDGLTGTLISSLVGSNANDRVGIGGITSLNNGNYLIRNPNWNTNRGAVTSGIGTTGISGIVSEANSLVGSNANDQVGNGGIAVLSNGNYVVQSPNWNGNLGAATWGSATTGIHGVVAEGNSLTGSNANDNVSNNGVTVLSNGNYVVVSGNWNGNRGAATWGSGTAGVSGAVSAANSLVGSTANDYVGAGSVLGTGGVTEVGNSNYVVASPNWNGVNVNVGAATWGSGTAGVRGAVSATNSLVGVLPFDSVGGGGLGSSVRVLSNGNYVVASPRWNSSRGAATWGSGTAGISGAVSAVNSLVGSLSNDFVSFNGIAVLTNGNYVVGSGNWNRGLGAATWGNGMIGITGIVSGANSLTGSLEGDSVAISSIWPLSNGNYVVDSPWWNGMLGAVTWASGTTALTGAVSTANSLTGSNTNDLVGYLGILALSNGNYVVGSTNWNDNRGAVTWGSGTGGVTGAVSDVNSLVGSRPGDFVGISALRGAVALTNGNYVVASDRWNDNRGAATWGSGTAGVTGTIDASNSLIGSSSNDFVAEVITTLSNGNYVVLSPSWTNGAMANAGAVTWGSGSAGINGAVSAANSLVGSSANDFVGTSAIALSNGNYLVRSPSWNGRAGAVTWASGTSGQSLDGNSTVTPQNSLVGRAANAGLGSVVVDPISQTFFARFTTERGGRVTVGLTDPTQLTYARAQSQTITITPDFLTHTLNTGTAVLLQASNDITIEDPIHVDAGGQGGDLTIQAGRSILINASITTDNGALTLIANDTLADGVVDAQRDAGNAFITMAGGTVLDTGTGPLDIELRDGAGLTNNSSRAINLQTISAGSVSIVNNGPSAGSDIRLETVTTNGPQSYANPHGTTTVAGYLLASGSPITFTDSVAVNAGVTVGFDGDTVDFAGSGTQTLQSASGSQFSNFTHTGSGTLRLTGGLNVFGSFLDAAGTFDANDQTVTVSGLAQITDGAYLAGTAPQNFHGGLVLMGGFFTSSTGPMTVTGPIAVLGGVLSGQGTIDSVTDIGGTFAPNPGMLSINGSVTLFTSSTFSVTLNGTDPASYSQVTASGSIDLGSSTLALTLGFTPDVGDSFTLLTAGDGSSINGTFAGLDEGATFMQDGIMFQITYQGGPNGNSVVLTRMA